MADQHIEITSEKPGDPLVKFSIGHDQLPKLKFKLDKPKKSGLSGLLERRRHSLASSDAPIGKKKENLKSSKNVGLVHLSSTTDRILPEDVD